MFGNQNRENYIPKQVILSLELQRGGALTSEGLQQSLRVQETC